MRAEHLSFRRQSAKVVSGLRGMKTNMEDPHRSLDRFAHVPVGQAVNAYAGFALILTLRPERGGFGRRYSWISCMP